MRRSYSASSRRHHTPGRTSRRRAAAENAADDVAGPATEKASSWDNPTGSICSAITVDSGLRRRRHTCRRAWPAWEARIACGCC